MDVCGSRRRDAAMRDRGRGERQSTSNQSEWALERTSGCGYAAQSRLCGLSAEQSRNPPWRLSVSHRPIQGRRMCAGCSTDGSPEARCLRGRLAAQREDPLRPMLEAIVASPLPAGQQGLSLFPVPGQWWRPTTMRLSDSRVGYRVDDLESASGHARRGVAGCRAAASDRGACRSETGREPLCGELAEGPGLTGSTG
jgi:hypothetical protein